MIRVGIVGMGRMGLSHLSIINTHPGVSVVGFCDATAYVLDGLNKYTGLAVFADPRAMLDMPRMLDLLVEVGIENPIICASINKMGFRMCGGIDLYEKTLAEGRFRPIAMSVLASGAIPPEEAIGYVCGLPNVQAIVFGASSGAHIRQTRTLVEQMVVRSV
jgi:hypothetical protein